MSSTLLSTAVAAVLFATVGANAQATETHTIRFANLCGYGTPTLIQGGQVLSTGEDHVVNSTFPGGIA
ncbi:hypothetical protein AcV7_004300 [Taiwanofungus camphoratus]|nr:hypothetical protein AcV7_004300 [Antrodia cinnamomea]